MSPSRSFLSPALLSGVLILVGLLLPWWLARLAVGLPAVALLVWHLAAVWRELAATTARHHALLFRLRLRPGTRPALPPEQRPPSRKPPSRKPGVRIHVTPLQGPRWGVEDLSTRLHEQAPSSGRIFKL